MGVDQCRTSFRALGRINKNPLGGGSGEWTSQGAFTRIIRAFLPGVRVSPDRHPSLAKFR